MAKKAGAKKSGMKKAAKKKSKPKTRAKKKSKKQSEPPRSAKVSPVVPQEAPEARMTTETPGDLKSIEINRAPVLTLWAAVVTERLGFEHESALTLGKAVAGLNAQSKGRRLGIFGTPKPPERGGPPKRVGLGEEFWVEVCGRPVPAKNTDEGIRAVILDKPIDPLQVDAYLRNKFGESHEIVRDVMMDLARSRSPEQLDLEAYGLYERFRPQIEPGRRGWGQKGTLDLELIRFLAKR